jgi:hypothetical protein
MVIERTGMYLLFANCHDDTNDAVPRREVVEPAGHFFTRRLIMDESEWLARPDLWGVELLADHKQRLAEHYSFLWLADNFLECPICRPLVHLLCTENGFNEDPLDSSEWALPPLGETQSFRQLALPAECTCGRESLYRWSRMRAIGVISGAELLNHFVQRLFPLQPGWPRPAGATENQQTSLLQRRDAWQYGRNLALDLCGPNPFRPITFLDTWRSESVVALARVAYDTRNFTLLPILADALEEAGCDNADVLTHCRGDGPHVRGCWVVDGVLGRV